MRFDKWDIRGFCRDDAVSLCNSGFNPLIAVLMASRGITAPDEIKELLDAGSARLHDPLLMADMDKAASRIKKAVADGEHIAVYGDYDVDGMTSAALLALWLDTQSAKYELYIPGRFDEGYGLHTGALDTLKSHGVKLVITVDCGITAVSEALYAKDIGLDLVITDHHECPGSLPEASAVVDPKRPDCNYPFKSLAGVGVVFKLICALESQKTAEEVIDRYGQLVALGTIADIMPVLGENRRLITDGLKALQTNPIPGLYSLIRESTAESSKISSETVSYSLAPRLNAAGRMGSPMLAVSLLLSRDDTVAALTATELSSLNNERRKLETEILDDIYALLEEPGEPEQTGPIVLAGTDWHQGVTGIVAAKIAERYTLPAIIISVDEGGMGHGSCRSYGAFSIYDALCACKDILETFGGHEMAAGLTVTTENIDELRDRVTDYYRKNMAQAELPGMEIDFEVEKPELLDLRNVETLTSLEPFGRGNPAPCLCIKGAVVTDIIPVGSGKHSKLKVSKCGHNFECIFFSHPPDVLGVAIGNTADIAFEPRVNEFRSRKTVQLQLSDIRRS